MSKKAAKVDKAPSEGLSQEEAARRVGCSQSSIGRALKRGDIYPLANGRVPEDAIEKLRELHQAAAREDQHMAELERRLLAAQAGEREAKMALRQLELEREKGSFVELAEVQRAGADAAQRILAVLRALPQRIAREVDAALAAPADRRAAAVEKIVAREVERAVAEMKRSLYLQVEESTAAAENSEDATT